MPPRKKTISASEGIAPVVPVKSAPAPKPAGYVFGRPTSYRPEFCELVIEWGKLGKSKTWMAAEMEISKETLYQWIKTFPDFSDAITRATVQCQKWWEDAGQTGMVSNLFNSTVWAKNMSCRFRDEWTDRQEISGADGGAIKIQDMSSVSDEQLRHLAAAGISGIGATGAGSQKSD